jgi:hypothetical protein
MMTNLAQVRKQLEADGKRVAAIQAVYRLNGKNIRNARETVDSWGIVPSRCRVDPVLGDALASASLWRGYAENLLKLLVDEKRGMGYPDDEFMSEVKKALEQGK